MNMRRWCCLWMALMMIPTLSAQEIGFGYYDVDRLYDTLPSPFYNDTDYTPAGRYRWDSERYRKKIERIAAVIDSMHLPIIALHGVENEQVVRDLSTALKGDYLYLHRTLNTFNGMEFALLYEGDRLIPLRVETGRQMLYIEALMPRDTVGILLTGNSRLLPYFLEEIRSRSLHLPLIVAGEWEACDLRPFGIVDRFTAAAARGFGNQRRKGGWMMRHRIATSPSLGGKTGEIYLQRFLLDAAGEYPAATFVGARYRGGGSKFLPLWVEIVPESL